MQKKVHILGSGWLGQPLADALLSENYDVRLSTSNKTKQQTLISEGYKIDLISIDPIKEVQQSFLHCDALIIAITSKEVSAFENLINQLVVSPIRQIIFISSTSVFDFCNCEIDAHAPTNNSAIAQIERLFLDQLAEKTTILRFSGLFGYDRKPANFFRYKPISNPKAFVNMIHRDDCIVIIQQLISKEIVNKCYNATADTHPTKQEFYTKASLDLGLSAPKIIETKSTVYKIILNDQLKKDLNYTFKFGDLMSIDFSSC